MSTEVLYVGFFPLRLEERKTSQNMSLKHKITYTNLLFKHAVYIFVLGIQVIFSFLSVMQKIHMACSPQHSLYFTLFSRIPCLLLRLYIPVIFKCSEIWIGFSVRQCFYRYWDYSRLIPLWMNKYVNTEFYKIPVLFLAEAQDLGLINRIDNWLTYDAYITLPKRKNAV